MLQMKFGGGASSFGTILIDPPWRFTNRTGKVAPEHERLRRYDTMSFATTTEERRQMAFTN